MFSSDVYIVKVIFFMIFFVCVLMLCTQMNIMFLIYEAKSVRMCGISELSLVPLIPMCYMIMIMIIEHIGIEGTRLSSEIPHTRTDLAS